MINLKNKFDLKGGLKKGVIYALLAASITSFSPVRGEIIKKEITSESKVETIDALVELRQPENLFLKLSNYDVNNHELDMNNRFIKNNLGPFIETKMPKYELLVENVYQKTGIPKFQNWGTMLNENNGHPTRVSYAGARGLMQILPGTYQEKKDRITYDIKKIKEVIPESDLDSLLKEDFVDYFVTDWTQWNFKLALKQAISAREGTKEYSAKELDWYIQRVPVALMVLKQYDGTFPGGGLRVNKVLDNPELNLQVNNIIKWDDLLRAVSFDCKLQEETFGKYSVLESNLPPEAIPYSYIAGPGRTMDLLKGAYKTFGSGITPELASQYFQEKMLNGTKSYVRNVLGAAGYFRDLDLRKSRAKLTVEPIAKPVDLLPGNAYFSEAIATKF